MSDFITEYSSIFYYLKETVLLSFIEKEFNVPLSYDQQTDCYLSQSVMDPNPVGKYRGWVYFDESNNKPIRTAEQTNRITVYKQGGTTISSSQYIPNYLLGGINYFGPLGPTNIPQYVDYYWNYVAVLDYWPGENMPELPFVVLDIVDTNKVGYQFGSGRKNQRIATIDVFASSAQELRDLTETIYNGFYLKSILCLDYNNKDYGHPLNYDGTFNSRFLSIQPHPDYNGCLVFDSVKATRVGLPVSINDLNRFRSRVTIIVNSYEERFT